jgi:hypothetical protein
MRYLLPLIVALGLSGALLATYLRGTAPEPLPQNVVVEQGASLIAGPEAATEVAVVEAGPASNPFAADTGGFVDDFSSASSGPALGAGGGFGMGTGLTQEHAAIMAGEVEGPPLDPDTQHISFERLSVPDYEGEPYFDDAEQKPSEEIFPPELLALDGQKVALDGFMNPLDFEGREVVSFLLSPYPPGCCFTGMPRYDELVDAMSATEGETFQWYPYRALRATGVLRVGEQLDEYGYVLSIYRLEVEKLEPLW